MNGRRFTQAALREVVVDEEGGLDRRSGALEERTEHTDDDRAALERRERVSGSLRAGEGVELEAVFHESRRRRNVIVGSECDDEDVGVVGGNVGDDSAMFGIDGRHGLLTELDSGLVDGAIRVPHFGYLAAPEHDIELREAEHERVALVDEGDANLVGDRFGQPGYELETAESRT